MFVYIMQNRDILEMENNVQEQTSVRKLVYKYLLEDISAHHVTSTKHKGNMVIIETYAEDSNSLIWTVLIST